jgi:hypothetical protein
MLHRMIPALLLVLALTGCGKDGGATKVHQYEGSVKFSITVPGEFESGVQYAKAVIRCGNTGPQCMATLAKDDPEQLEKDVIAACKTLVCK